VWEVIEARVAVELGSGLKVIVPVAVGETTVTAAVPAATSRTVPVLQETKRLEAKTRRKKLSFMGGVDHDLLGYMALNSATTALA